MRRGARFEIVDDNSDEGTLRDSDWVVLDVTPQLLQQLVEKIQTCLSIEKSEKLPSENRFWTVHMYVKPSHPKTVGPDKPDGSAPEVTWMPSLLTDEIPKIPSNHST